MRTAKKRLSSIVQTEDIPRCKTRVFPVDMMRIEDARDIGPLTKLEREVKEKIASAPSPYMVLAKAEEEQELEDRRNKLRELVREGGLTHRQRECFRLLCEDECTVPEAAQQMGVTEKRILELQDQIATGVKKYLRFLERRRVAINILESNPESFHPVHLEILRLRYRDNLSSSQIAIRLGRNRLSIDRILKLLSSFGK